MTIPDQVFDDATRLHKSVVIAKSGIYKYSKHEIGGFTGLDGGVPDSHKHRTIFNVYRPPEVLSSAKELFKKQPATVEHPREFIDGDNFRKYVVGWTGDSVDVEQHANGRDVLIKSSLNLIDSEALDAYRENVREVSPGYRAVFAWSDGVTDSGIEYQIVMKEITEVNHLALTEAGRGGKDASIIDHKGVERMDVLKELKKLLGVKERVLDSLPRNGKYTEEEKDYLLREVHSLLNHVANGKTLDSFAPEGYDVKDGAHESEGESQGKAKKEIEKAQAEHEKEKVVDEDKEEVTEDTLTTEAEKGFKEDPEEAKEIAADPETKEAGEKKEKESEPIKEKKNGTNDSREGSHLTSVTDSATIEDSVLSFDQALRSGTLHNYLTKRSNK